MNKKLAEFLTSEYKWEGFQVDLGLRAKFCCEYCGKSLLGNVDNHYDWQVDHIKPTKKGGGDDLENLALSCKQCNFIKRGYYPDELDDKSRAEKTKYFKEYIFQKRRNKQRELEAIIEAIHKYT